MRGTFAGVMSKRTSSFAPHRGLQRSKSVRSPAVGRVCLLRHRRGKLPLGSHERSPLGIRSRADGPPRDRRRSALPSHRQSGPHRRSPRATLGAALAGLHRALPRRPRVRLRSSVPGSVDVPRPRRRRRGPQRARLFRLRAEAAVAPLPRRDVDVLRTGWGAGRPGATHASVGGRGRRAARIGPGGRRARRHRPRRDDRGRGVRRFLRRGPAHGPARSARRGRDRVAPARRWHGAGVARGSSRADHPRQRAGSLRCC